MATLGAVPAYVFYWILAIALLVWMKYSEGRTRVLGWDSAAGKRRREEKAHVAAGDEMGEEKDGLGISELPRWK